MAIDNYLFSNIYLSGASTICSVNQDERGIMWIGTNKGLYSYDGYHSFPHFENNSISNNRVHAIEVYDEKVFLGCDVGLLIYNYTTNIYEEAIEDAPTDIRAILRQDNILWLGTSKGLYSYDINGRVFKAHANLNKSVYSLLATSHGLYVGTISGLYIYNEGTINEINIKSGVQPLVNALYYDNYRRCIWVGTEGALYKKTQDVFEPIGSLNGNSVKSFAQKDNGTMLVGTDNGIYAYDVKDNCARVAHDSRLQHSLANNIVWTIFSDTHNNIWIGTDCGLSLLSGDKMSDVVPLDRITKNGYGNCLHVILRDSRGTLWLGGTNGLIKYDEAKDGKEASTIWYRQSNEEYYLSHNRVRRVYEDVDGDIWVATDCGINYYDKATKKFRNFIVSEQSGKYTARWAYDILSVSDDYLWVSAYNGGIFVVNKKQLLASNGNYIAYKHIDDVHGGMSGTHVAQMFKDKYDNVWATVYDSGVDCININDYTVSHVENSHGVDMIASDSHGRIWTSKADGLRCYDKPQDEPVFYASEVGMSLPSVTAMCDVDGSMWTVSGNICRVIGYDKPLDAFFRIPQTDSYIAYYSPQTQSVIIGGNDGYVIMPAFQAQQVNDDAHMVLSQILINGNRLTSLMPKYKEGTDVKLSSSYNNITMFLTDMPYLNHLSMAYKYKLEGYDSQWHNLQDGGFPLIFNSLQPGDYKLLVRTTGESSDVDDAKNVYQFTFTILHPWYLSIWAKIAYVLMFLLLLRWLIHFYLVKRRLKEERSARLQIIEQSQARVSFFNDLSVKIKTPLAAIMEQVYSLLLTTNDIKLQQQADVIRRNANGINGLVHRALDMLSVNKNDNNRPIKTLKIDVVDFCRRIIDDMRTDSTFSSYLYDFHTTTSSLHINVDVLSFQSIMYTLLGYVSLHSSSSNIIEVNVEKRDSRAFVTVKSSSMQIDKASLPFVFQRYYQPMVSTDKFDSFSQSLYLVKNYVELFHGTTEVMSDVSSGTTFILSFEAVELKTVGSASAASPVAEVVGASNDSRLLDDITNVIEAHLSDSEFNVTRLQKLTGIGSKLLYRRLKQMTAKSPVEYIRHVRMQRASQLLREGKFSVSEVMCMVGFSNSSYFSKCFTKVYGLSPTEYSKRK